MVKNPPDNSGDMDLIPGLERSPGEGTGCPLQCSCLENPMGREAWWATVSPWGRKESDTTERLIDNKCSYLSIQETLKHLEQCDHRK